MKVVHAGSSSMSDCSTARKVRVTKGIQLRTEKDSLELRQEGSWLDQWGGGHLSSGNQICVRSS